MLSELSKAVHTTPIYLPQITNLGNTKKPLSAFFLLSSAIEAFLIETST